MYTYVMLIFINGCFLNVIFSIRKVLNCQNFSHQNFHSLQCYLEKPTPLNACFLLFTPLFFNSNFIKFYLSPLQLWFYGIHANQVMDSTLVAVNQRKALILSYTLNYNFLRTNFKVQTHYKLYKNNQPITCLVSFNIFEISEYEKDWTSL